MCQIFLTKSGTSWWIFSDIHPSGFIPQTDQEEEKAQEAAKYQDALLALQKQLEEADANILKEREAARKAIEEAPPVIKETPVMVENTEKINMLMEEVENLKVGILFYIVSIVCCLRNGHSTILVVMT